MKSNKSFLVSALSLLTVASLVACSKGGNQMNDWGYDPEIEYEVGDTVKEWKSDKDWKTMPMDVPEGGTGTREINKKLGHEDKISLHYSVKSSQGYITSKLEEDQFFNDLDAKNGDIISLYVYIPSNSNLKSLQLEADSLAQSGQGAYLSNFNGKSDELKIDADKEEKWIRLMVVYETFLALDAIKLNFVPIDNSKEVEFYVDDINITYGEETENSNYESNDESLYKTYEDYFIVGTELSANMAKDTKMREIAKDNFISVTAENEGKPDSVLDQAGCQELARTDPAGVAIKTSAFEGIYDWCEANHIKVRHHCFVWDQQTPSWFFKENYSNSGADASREVMLARLENFFKVTIETLDERWPGLVYALDVVNEAIKEIDELKSSNWLNRIGNDYIYQAFAAASQYKTYYMDLYYNDYVFEQTQWGGKDRCEWACNTMLKQAIDDGILDGIGIQTHIDFSDVDTVLEDAKIIHNAGIKCQITELDINCNGSSEFEEQKDAYQKLIKGIVEGNESGTMDVNAVILWGVTDNLSWHSNRSPLIFNSDYSKKPAYYGFLEALNEE